ncbi:MAG: transporter substrate-binding domain-containing protein [Desulfobacteraceae bacterium]|nr:transporter substrate-binding domain-containing protein [Desulfobacteraceae bacterium]MCB9494791.1 transporter substrate-binding domain-containing protein [Desulfobacteraceae bacterium]
MTGRKFFKNIFLLLISLLFFANLCYSASLKVGYIEFPPVFSTNSDGKPEGILIDLAGKVLPEAGYEWEAFSYPVKRMSDYIAKGKLDLWIGLKTIPDFEGTTFKGDSEVLKITLKAYRTKNIPDIKKQEDLNSKSIIIIRGYSYGGWINYIKDVKNSIDFIETNDHKSAFRMLKAGRADYVLDYQNPAEKALKNLDIENLKENTISSFGAYFVVSKQTPDAENVLKNLEKAYKKLKKNGEL